jgi:hypothetical protein
MDTKVVWTTCAWAQDYVQACAHNVLQRLGVIIAKSVQTALLTL